MLLALLDDDVTGCTGAAAAAGMFERDVEVLRDVEERLRLAMVRVRQLAVLELDGLRFAVDDECDLWHMFVRRRKDPPYTADSRGPPYIPPYMLSTLLPDSAAWTDRCITPSARRR